MMLLNLICSDCLLEQIEAKNVTKEPENYLLTPFEPVNDSGLYDVSCPNGHNSKTYIDNIDFEILFDYSINAIADGYYREAVSSFTSAMERYFEFFIKAILRNSKTEFTEIDKIWKLISKQSERQLGAYITLYAQTFNGLPLLLSSNKEVPFRNKVVHQGYIPTKQEAINFGNTTLKIIETSLLNLKKSFPELTKEVFNNYGYQRKSDLTLKELEKKTGKKINVGGVNILTTISVMAGREIHINDDRKGNIEHQIERVVRNRNQMRISIFNEMPTEKK